MKKYMSIFIVLYIAWIAFAGVSTSELVLGAIVSIMVSLLISNTVVHYWEMKDSTSIFKLIFLYLPLFLYKIVRSNVEMAKTVLSPSLPKKSGFVIIHTGLKSDVGKFVLANSITLTPGTITVDVNEDAFLIHCVDIKGKNENEYFDFYTYLLT